jgi:uncharacterized protein (TIGR03083 family)
MSVSDPNAPADRGPSDATSADWLAAVRRSHQHLATLVEPLDDDAVEAQSYDSEWSIAQVLSHLGSGAEIFTLLVDAGVDGTPPPGMEAFQPIWAEWNAKSPQEQARDAIRADAAFVDRLDSLDDAQREGWSMELFGSEQSLADLLRMRLGEHAVHTWDVAVALDPAATVQPQAVELLIDNIDQTVARGGKAPEQPIDISVNTEAPSRSFRLSSGEALSLTPQEPGAETGGDATVQLPAEALIRLVYGRLDPDHTPPISADGIEVDDLRGIFPGF